MRAAACAIGIITGILLILAGLGLVIVYPRLPDPAWVLIATLGIGLLAVLGSGIVMARPTVGSLLLFLATYITWRAFGAYGLPATGLFLIAGVLAFASPRQRTSGWP